MKDPKEPETFKYPRMYASFGFSHNDLPNFTRLRIIHPNGTSNWFGGHSGADYGKPCWWQDSFDGRDAVKAMEKYCKHVGLDCVYIGEIK